MNTHVPPPVIETATQLAVVEKRAAPPLPVFSVRPFFDRNLSIVYGVIAMVIGTLILTTVGGTLVYLLFMLLGLANFIPIGYIYGLVMIAGIVCIGPLFFELREKAFKRTIFHFYPTHVDYQYFNFHLERRRGRLRYRDIEDVSQQASALQDQRGLTTIYLYASSMGYQTRRPFDGLRLIDVPLKSDYMSRIMDIIENSEMLAAQSQVPMTVVMAAPPQVIVTPPPSVIPAPPVIEAVITPEAPAADPDGILPPS